MTLVVCLGNDMRGDDAAGPLAAARLRERGVAAVVEAPERLIDRFEDSDDVVVVDAVRSGAPAGTIHRLDAVAQPLPPELAAPSTHLFGLADAVELARVTGRLPASLRVIGIEGRVFETGAPVSAEVEAALDAVVAELGQGGERVPGAEGQAQEPEGLDHAGDAPVQKPPEPETQ